MVNFHSAFPARTLQNAVLTRPTWDVIDTATFWKFSLCQDGSSVIYIT